MWPDTLPGGGGSELSAVFVTCDNACTNIHNNRSGSFTWCSGTIGGGERCQIHKHLNHMFMPFKPSRCIKASFHIPENRLNCPTTRDFRMNIPMKLVYQHMEILFTFSLTSNHLHPLQVENCDSNSRLVVDEDDNGEFRLDRVNFWTSVADVNPALLQHWVNISYLLWSRLFFWCR